MIISNFYLAKDQKLAAKRLKQSLIACALSVFALSAFAQGNATPNNAPAASASATEMPAQHKKERQEKRYEKLKQKLALNAEQETAWTTFSKSMQIPEGKRDKKHFQRDEIAKMSAPDRMNWILQKHKERLQILEQRTQAVQSFYAVLNTEQKKTFDEETLRLYKHLERK